MEIDGEEAGQTTIKPSDRAHQLGEDVSLNLKYLWNTQRKRPKIVRRLHSFIIDGVLDSRFGRWYDKKDPHWKWYERLIENLWNKVCCTVFGHFVVDDHCGIPEHRFCTWCTRRQPNATVARWPEDYR